MWTLDASWVNEDLDEFHMILKRVLETSCKHEYVLEGSPTLTNNSWATMWSSTFLFFSCYDTLDLEIKFQWQRALSLRPPSSLTSVNKHRPLTVLQTNSAAHWKSPRSLIFDSFPKVAYKTHTTIHFLDYWFITKKKNTTQKQPDGKDTRYVGKGMGFPFSLQVLHSPWNCMCSPAGSSLKPVLWDCREALLLWLVN